MRTSLYLLAAIGTLAFMAVPGCGDGEEGGGQGGTGGVDGGTGGTGGTGGDASACYSTSFSKPSDGAKLGAADDLDGDCSNGVQVDVALATSAPSGTQATLSVGGQQAGTAAVSGGQLVFSDVQLPSKATATLTVSFPSQPGCAISIDVETQCDAPTCVITKPIVTPTHPELNGVSVAEGGDRVSAPGQDYQVAFEVQTDIEDNQAVTLAVDGTANAAVAIAQGGKATFAGVTLIPDGEHKVSATCVAQSGKTGQSQEAQYTVDTTPPDLANLTPADGHFFGPSDDSNATKAGLQFRVCGETTAPDAVDLPSSLGGGEVNFCVGIGTGTPTCVPATTGGAGTANGGCAELDCPGGAPFDLTVTLKDDAGNPTPKKITGVRCASTLPSVQIVEPIDGTGADVSKHILAASSTQARKDQDANTAGAQYTVIACTDVAGGSGQLLAGPVGATTPVGAPVVATAATPADNCPAGLGHVLKFTNVTLPESAQDTTGALTVATELKVEVTDVSTVKGTSPAVQVWVDSIAPTISEQNPNPLCGKLYQSATAVQQTNFQLVSTAAPVAVQITSSAGTQNLSAGTAPGSINFGTVTFQPGSNTVAATTTEPSGNTGALKSPCTVTVGNPPVVNWVAPTAATNLNASTDATPGTAGWQGALTVQTDVGGTGATVTFTLDCGGTITSIGTVSVDSSGVATLSNSTVPECASGKLIATTSNVSGKGVGTAQLTKVVDTIVPGTPTALVASVKDRRATTFGLTWTAPADNGQPVGGYAVRVSKQPITAANFDAAEAVTFAGTPKSPGGAESLDVTNRVIENDYYFAVAATDAAGNRSGIISAGPQKATFNTVILPGAGTEGFGFAIDGSASINGDGLADLLVGSRSGNIVRVYFGKSGGYATTPNLTFTAPAGIRFGAAVRVVGDIDADGFADIAIGAPLEASRGRVYVFKGRASWPANLNSTDADYIIETNPAADAGFNNGSFGGSIAPLGDFNGDGAADFAVGSQGYSSGNGYVAIILGVTSGNTFPASVVLPAALGTRAAGIAGPTGVNLFGITTTSLAAFYSGGAPALVAAANQTGRVYAFKGGSALPATISLASGELYAGSQPLRTGTVLNPLGALFGVPGLGVGSPAVSSAVGGGDARLFFGAPGTGVFSGTVATFTNSQATGLGDQFGAAVFGGGFPGSTAYVSFINGSGPDVAMSSAKLGGASPPKLYIIDGSKAATSADIVSVADVVYTLPAGWLGAAFLSGPVRDANGDGYAEIAVGEQQGAATPGYPGQVLVLW